MNGTNSERDGTSGDRLRRSVAELVREFGGPAVRQAVVKPIVGPDFDNIAEGQTYARHQRPGDKDYFQIIPSPILSAEEERQLLEGS